MRAPEQQNSNAEEWARRKRSSVRMAWGCAAIVLVLFALSIWKYRPL